jgi:3'(2'), 5'-bisphosphate nucleotidase
MGEFRKDDKTSVSLADFAAQALLVAAIHHNFPGDTIVGEEETAILRSDQGIADRVWELVSTTHLEDEECEKLLLSPVSPSDMLHYIDLGGTSYGGPKGRVWMIDPVDGTKGFLKDGQYVVCYAAHRWSRDGSCFWLPTCQLGEWENIRARHRYDWKRLSDFGHQRQGRSS